MALISATVGDGLSVAKLTTTGRAIQAIVSESFSTDGCPVTPADVVVEPRTRHPGTVGGECFEYEMNIDARFSPILEAEIPRLTRLIRDRILSEIEVMRHRRIRVRVSLSYVHWETANVTASSDEGTDNTTNQELVGTRDMIV